jgi:putative nucleotidyltransferase with HDIG domain
MIDRINELEEQVDILATDLAGNFYQTTQLLGSIVSTQERYYEGSHSRFVAQKSSEIAQDLGMSDTSVYETKIAGLLHDIGKIGFRETLHSKYTQEMTNAEFKQYMLHPELGMQILSKHEGFSSIASIVHQHHERIDGSGFPRHLQENEIHPGARIISVVDTYHNMMFKQKKDKTSTSGSSIKYSSTNQYLDSTQTRFGTTMNYINMKAEVLFDKKVVEAFIENIELERRIIGKQTVMRLPIGKLVPGMTFAEDYFTSYGLLVAANGEQTTEDTIKALFRLAEADQIPPKILVMR